MWQALGAIGSLAGGLGGLASGLGLGSSESAPSLKGRDMKQSIKIQMKHRLKNARKWSRRYGFHPLAALGINPSVSGGIGRATGSGVDFARMGQGLERALKGVQQLDPQAKELNRITLEQEKQKLENMKLQNHGLMKEIQDRDTQTGPPASGIVEQNIPLQHPAYASGNQEGRAVKGLYQLYRHPDGMLLKIPAEDAADYLSESVIDAAILQSKRWWSNLTRNFRSKMNQNQVMKIRDELDDMENFMRQNGELRPDEYLQFSAYAGVPVVKRSQGERKKLIKGSTADMFFKRIPLRYGGMRFRRN